MVCAGLIAATPLAPTYTTHTHTHKHTGLIAATRLGPGQQVYARSIYIENTFYP